MLLAHESVCTVHCVHREGVPDASLALLEEECL